MRTRAIPILLLLTLVLGSPLIVADETRATAESPKKDESETCKKGEVYVEGHGCQLVPVRIKHVAPRYPAKARRERVTGHVVIEALISTEGRLIDIKVVSADPTGWGFEEAAVEAAKKWRYKPGRSNGKLVDVYLTAKIAFRL